MSFINTLKALFKAPKDDSDLYPDPVAVASHERFRAANDTYNAAFDVIKPYTIRANHRSAVSRANSNHLPGLDASNKVVADYIDPADFEPYTEAYLDDHTAAMDRLAEAFDNLTTAFDTLNLANVRYALNAYLYKANCDTFVFAASAYSEAAHCAIDTALNGQFQSVIDKTDLLAKGVTEATIPDINYEVLERKATVAEAKARAFIVKAKFRQGMPPIT